MVKRNNQHINIQKKGKQIDEYMCLICLKQYKSNHGHHFIFFSEGGEATTDNIITLCPECHRLYHSGKLRVDIRRF